MAAPSPVQLATSNADWTITANGTPIATTIQVVAIDVWLGVNKLPKARLVISDGSPAAEDFPISDGNTFIPGTVLTIALGYAGSLTTVFTGIVYAQGLEITLNGPSRLVVEATDKAMVMTLARQNAIFQNLTDSQLCQQLIAAAGLTADVTATSISHPTIVQYYATTWDLVILRAQASSMVVTVAAGTVTVAPPNTSQTPVLTLTYGQSILEFRAAMDASTQFTPAAIQSFAWDSETQALAAAGTPQASVATPGNLSSATLAAVFGVGQYLQQTPGEMATAELTQWSSAELLKSQLAKIRGTVRFQGSALALPGSMVTLAGLGDRFNGNGYVSAVHHSLTGGHWRTTLEIGLSPSWFAETAGTIAAPAASGQLPAAAGIQSGVVKQIATDPDGDFRVLVTLPLVQGSSLGVWARFGSFYASVGVGAFFYPEIGDEVVVAFLGNDPRYPVILGSLYSKKNMPPDTPATANNVKSIMSKSKMHIDFIEDTKEILITTPGNQSVQINDSTKAITLTDMNGNTVTMNASGITLNSAKDITLTASGSIALTAGSAMTLAASTTFSAKGSSSAQLTSTGTVQVKGAQVALNP